MKSQVHDGDRPEDVVERHGGGLLLVELVERLEGRLLRPGPIARLLHEDRLTSTEKGLRL